MAKYVDLVLLFFCIYVACLFRSTSAENTDCETTPFENGTQVHLEAECRVFVNENKNFSKTSILRIVLEIKRTNDDSNATSATVTDVTSATVTIEELSREGKYIKKANWIIYSNKSSEKSHFSENINMKITFYTTGNWSGINVSLYYEEIEFKQLNRSTSDVDKTEITPWENEYKERHYRPNSEYIFYIENSKDQSFNNILITLNKLDMDEDEGEYLLIGAGLNPFERSSFKSINKSVGKKEYVVYDADAYIAFVTRATRKNYTGFNITWEYRGKEKEPDEEIGKDDVKQSAPICIYNITAAQKEAICKNPEDCFMNFRESLAKVATNYTKYVKRNLDSEISASDVSIFRISGTFKDEGSRQALYAMVKIADARTKGKALFKYYELERIISMYSEDVSLHDSFEIRKCGPRYVPESWFYFGLILIIPVLCFALLLWIWKQNPIAEHYEKKRRLKRASRVEHSKYYVDSCDSVVQSTTAENPYTTLPKLQVTNELGRRTTLNLSDTLLCNDNASDDELFNKMYTRRRSDIFELHRMRTTSRLFLSNQGEDNAAFVLDEGNTNAAGEQLQHEEKAEHTYESVRSSASLFENTRL